jgi:hypothetical protein
MAFSIRHFMVDLEALEMLEGSFAGFDVDA